MDKTRDNAETPPIQPVEDLAAPAAHALGRRRTVRPQFLVPKARSGNGHGYTSDPPRPLESSFFADPPAVVELVAAAVSMTDEPECVGPAIADEFGEHARFLHRIRREAALMQVHEIRAGLTVERRVADCVRRAKQQHVDVTGDVHVITVAVDQARLKGRNVRPAIMRRLEQLEARLDESLEPWKPRR